MACHSKSGTFPATSDVAITLGAQPLDAEESVNYSLGTVFRFGGFEATIDAYRIDIDDRIVLSENLNTPQVAALIAPFGATVARFFINGVETKTEGIDLVTRYLWRTEKRWQVRVRRRGQLERHGSREGAVHQCHRQHLRGPARALHAARAVRIASIRWPSKKARPTARSAWESTGSCRSAPRTSA